MINYSKKKQVCGARMWESIEHKVRRALDDRLRAARVGDVQVHPLRRPESHGGVHESDFQ